MIKKIMLLTGSLLSTIAALTQQIIPNIISPTGNNSKSGKPYPQHTLRELVIENNSLQHLKLTEINTRSLYYTVFFTKNKVIDLDIAAYTAGTCILNVSSRYNWNQFIQTSDPSCLLPIPYSRIIRIEFFFSNNLFHS